MKTYLRFGSRCRRNSPSVYRTKNMWDKRCRIEQNTHFTRITLSRSPSFFETIEQEGRLVYVFVLVYLTPTVVFRTFTKITDLFFIASHLNLWVYAYANTYLMCIELNVSLQPPLYYKWSFVTSIERHVRRKTVMRWPNFPSCLIILITYASLAFISYIDEVPNFYRIRLSCVFYMLTCEVLLPT